MSTPARRKSKRGGVIKKAQEEKTTEAAAGDGNDGAKDAEAALAAEDDEVHELYRVLEFDDDAVYAPLRTTELEKIYDLFSNQSLVSLDKVDRKSRKYLRGPIAIQLYSARDRQAKPRFAFFFSDVMLLCKHQPPGFFKKHETYLIRLHMTLRAEIHVEAGTQEECANDDRYVHLFPLVIKAPVGNFTLFANTARERDLMIVWLRNLCEGKKITHRPTKSGNVLKSKSSEELLK